LEWSVPARQWERQGGEGLSSPRLVGCQGRELARCRDPGGEETCHAGGRGRDEAVDQAGEGAGDEAGGAEAEAEAVELCWRERRCSLESRAIVTGWRGSSREIRVGFIY